MYIRLVKNGFNKGQLIEKESNVELLVDHTKPSYTSLFYYDNESYSIFKKTGSVSGITNVVTDRIVFDFDDAKNPDYALECCRQLAQKLRDKFPNITYQTYFSGNKGYHLEIKSEQMITPTQFKVVLANLAGDIPYDKTVSDPARLFRLTNTKHQKSGLYKIPLTEKEFKELYTHEIKELAKTPRIFPIHLIPITLPINIQTESISETVIDAQIQITDIRSIDFTKRPQGWSKCKWALVNGFFEQGEGNEALMCIATTCKSLNYTKQQTYYFCKNALEMRKQRTGASWSKSELWYQVINYVYGPNWKGTVYNEYAEGTWLYNYSRNLGLYEPKTGGIKIRKINEILESDEKVNWLVDGLLTEGGLSLIVGKPKSGKSTLVRQLARSVARGEKFLDRDVQQGTVLYLALEEQPAVLKHQFETIGINVEDPIFMHIGGLNSKTVIAELHETINDLQPSLLIIDTLFLMLDVENGNDYKEVNTSLAIIRELARSTNTHIICVHHQNKGGRGTSSIMGSVAIHGAVDNAIMFNVEEPKRYITTSQRSGQSYKNHELIYNETSDTYILGEPKEWDGF